MPDCTTGVEELGKLELVTAVGKKDWKKYGYIYWRLFFGILDDPEPASVRHVGALVDRAAAITGNAVASADGLEITFHLFTDISGTFQVSFRSAGMETGRYP